MRSTNELKSLIRQIKQNYSFSHDIMRIELSFHVLRCLLNDEHNNTRHTVINVHANDESDKNGFDYSNDKVYEFVKSRLLEWIEEEAYLEKQKIKKLEEEEMKRREYFRSLCDNFNPEKKKVNVTVTVGTHTFK